MYVQLAHWAQDRVSEMSEDNLLSIHCTTLWRNRCIWPHAGGSEDVRFEEVKFEAITGSYL